MAVAENSLQRRDSCKDKAQKIRTFERSDSRSFVSKEVRATCQNYSEKFPTLEQLKVANMSKGKFVFYKRTQKTTHRITSVKNFQANK